jgi:N-acetylneuraminic acid mutarotase
MGTGPVSAADTTPPAAPTGLTATASTAAVALNWNDNVEADLAGYHVYRSANSSGPWTLLNGSLLTTSAFNDVTAQPGVTFFYAVAAMDNSGNTSPAAQTSAARFFTTINWSSAAAAPLKRSEAFGAFANGKLYLFGGYYGDPSWTPTPRADVYDPATNTWRRIANLPAGLSHAGIAVDGNNIYFAGGYPIQADGTGLTFSTSAVWKYDTSTNTYTSMPALPAARGGGALVRIDRTLHFFGGSSSTRKNAGAHYALNIDTGTTWTTLAPMLVARNHLAGVSLNGKIYAVGGQSGQDAGAIYRNNVDAYDPVTNAWTAVASLPRARSHHNASTFVMGGRIIVVGGESAYSNGRLANVTAYDPATNAWTELTPLPVKRTAAVADQFNGVIYETTGSMTSSTYKGMPVATP